MRLSSLLSSLPLLLLIAGCGGGVAPTSDQQSSGSSGSSGSSSTSGGSSGSGQQDSSGSNQGSTGTRGICTPGAYVFCRCADRSEGTKLCRDDGASFEACSCDAPPTPPVCSYPPPNNPPDCPAVYSHTYNGQPCDTLNLECKYPGAGDGTSDGCYSTAVLACRVQPGGAQRWVASQ